MSHVYVCKTLFNDAIGALSTAIVDFYKGPHMRGPVRGGGGGGGGSE